MAQCKLTAHEFIQNTFSPMVAVMCSPLVNQVCQKNNLSFIEMVQPFCKLNTEAYIRDPSGTPVQVRNLRLLMQDINARPPEPLLARKFLNESVSQSYSERSSSFQIGANENIEIPSSVPWFDAWRETFLQVQFPSDHEFTKHYIACILVVSSSESSPADTLQHMGQDLQQLQSVAPAKLPKWFCPGALRYYVLVHDPADCDHAKAEAAFGSMKAAHGDTHCYFMPINSLPVGCGEEQSHLPDPWSQFLLRHADNLECSDHDSSPRTPVDGSMVAAGMPNSIVTDGETFEGSSNAMLQTGLVMMSSLELGQEAGESSPAPTPISVMHHPLSPDCSQTPATADRVVANNVNCIPNHINSNVWVGQASRVQLTSQHGDCLTASDLERLRTFVQDFYVKALLPYVEQQIQQFSDLISNKKGVSRSLFSATKRWFGSNKPGMPGVNAAANAVIYTNDAPELQLRRLGDLCFMFGLYPLAFQAYHSAKRDFNTDQAWLYYAGALEMASLAAFMQGEMTKKTQDYMEESIITYLNSCRMPQFATRATLLSTECLKARGLQTEAARQFIRMTSEDSDLRSALLLEQASYCFLKSTQPRMVRKYAFHVVLAGHRFSKAGQRRHSQRCYKQALQVFENKNWGLAEDHIHYTIGRTASHLKQVSEAAQFFSRLLYPGSSQPALQQAAFLREYLAAQLQLREESCGDGSVLPLLPLPVIVSNSVRVLIGPIQSQLPRDPASNKVPASGVEFSDDGSDNTRWHKLEELMVMEAEGALPMIFKPTVHLFTNNSINTSRPIAVVREPIFVCAALQNPFHISLMLRNVYLLWEFVSSSTQVDNETNTEESSRLVDTQLLESFLLRPNCIEDVVLCVTPTVVGTFHLKGIAYSIANLMPPAPAEGNSSDVLVAPQLVPGKQLFVLKLPQVKSPKAKTLQDPNDLRLELTVVPSAPCLQVVFEGLPTEMLCGELQLVTVQFTNVGKAPLKCLYASWSLPECFSLEERSRPVLRPQQVTKIPLPCELAPGGTHSTRFWLRAPDLKGTNIIDMMFYYENDCSVPRYRVVRHSWQLSVLSSIEVLVTAMRSAASSQGSPQEFLNLTMSLKNSNQVHDPVMTEIMPVQLSLASNMWQLVDKVFIPNEAKLQFQESVHCLAKACRKFGNESSGSIFSDVVINKTGDANVVGVDQSPYIDFYYHHFPVQEAETDGDSREDNLEKLEAAQNVDLVVILRWQVAIYSLLTLLTALIHSVLRHEDAGEEVQVLPPDRQAARTTSIAHSCHHLQPADRATELYPATMVSFTSDDPAPDDVVISGIGGTFPQSRNLDEFGNNLLDNIDMVQDILSPNWQIDKLGVLRKGGAIPDKDIFDTAFFGISQAQACRMDPLMWRILENTFKAIIDSGFNPSDLRNTKTAIIMGSFTSESETLLITSFDTEEGVTVVGHNRSMLANRVSYWLNTKGTSYSYYAEESAGIIGLEMAQQLIATHQCDSAIVGTVSLASLPETTSAYMGLGCLSSDGKCRSFDANGTGYAKSEACVVMYLQRAKFAKRIYATVVHAESSYNGNRNCGFARPISDQMVQLLEHFYEKCGVDPTQIVYLEASGCGLQIYEEAEFKAVSKVLLSRRKSPLLIGSVKSNMGQASAASSACSIAKLLVAMERGIIPANLHFETLGPHISALTEGRVKVVTENTKWSPGLVAVNCIEMTGHCGHVVLRPCMKVKSTSCGINDKLPRLICLSGRNEEGIEKIIKNIHVLAPDDEFVRLVQDVYSSNITNHNYRSYLVASDSNKTETKYYDGSKRPVWFVFSGMGSQWPGMATHLMKLPVIADTLHQCHAILQPKGVDLMAILTRDDPGMLDNILHSFVGIAAVQIALVETLRMLNIQPDGIIGHSVGELGCAYADGCFTMEQMILAAYYRGLASLEAELIEGRMAAIGMGYKNLKDLVPQSIDIACHNSDDSSTISGPTDAITQFVSELRAQYIFTKEVNVSNIAYHSRYIKPAAPKLLAYLRNVIPEPKLRSPRWYSTSAPEELWDTDEARYSSAQYHTNNLLKPVLFEEASKHIPKNAILIEIAPHGLLQAILKRSMGSDCINIPLTQRRDEQGVEFLLHAVGKLYLAGIVPCISALYPPIQFPVSRGTPSIASLATWDHSQEWHMCDNTKLDERRPMETNVNLNLNGESCILKDYVVNGHIILPAAAALVLVWKEFGNSISRNFSKMPVVFENIKFCYIPVFIDNGSLDINIFLQRATGNFEIYEKGKDQIFAKGQVRTVKDISAEFSTITEYEVTDGERLTSHDIYTELENRGFEYGEQFCKIREATLNNQGFKALIDWCDDWVVAIDLLLQLVTLHSTEGKQLLQMPIFMQKVVIDPCGETANSRTNGNVAQFNNFTNTACCKSIEVRGVKTKGVHMEQSLDVKISTITFIPFKKSQFQSPCDFNDRAIKLLLQNKSATSKNTVTLTVLVNEKSTNGISSEMENVFKENSNVKVLMNTLSVSDNQNKSHVGTGNLLLASDFTIDEGIMLIKNHGGFLLANVSSDKDIKLHKDVAIIDEQCFEDRKWIFMKKCAVVTNSIPVVFLPKVERLKSYEDFSEETSTKKYFVSENSSLDEVKAFVADVNTGKIHSLQSYRFVFIVDRDAPPFCPTSSFYTQQLQLDLMMNIYYHGSWGSMIDSLLPYMPATLHSSFSNLASSLRMKDLEWNFIGVNLQNLKTLRRGNDQAHVLDMSGYTVDGRKVMCVAHVRPGSVQATTASHLTWEVPDAWSAEDTATVPLAYSMAYYALVLKGDARSGESILIHAGHTHLGQAFISVALQRGLVVCTTVSNNKHRVYLRKKFPQILDSDIYDLNSSYLEAELLKKSGNKGFKLVMNPLEHFLQQSVKCAGLLSRLLQLCTTQMEQNKDFGMEPFLKHLAIIPIIPEMMFEMNPAWRTRLHEMMTEGIETGVVQPLDREVFTVAKEHEVVSTLDDLDCTKKVLITKDSYCKQQVMKSSKLHSNNSYPKTLFFFDDEVSCLIVGDTPGTCLVYAEWLVSRGCRYITLCCNSSAVSSLANRHIRILRTLNVSIDVVSLEKTHTLEHTIDLLHGINTIAPLAAIFMLSVKDALSMYLLELALCEADLGTTSVVLTNCNKTTVKHMRKSTGLPILDLQMSSKVKGTKLQVLFRLLEELLLSKPNESVYLSVEEKDAPHELMSEEQLSILLPSSVEQLERLGEDLILDKSCSLEEVCSKSPRLLHVKEVHPVFIIPGLHGPAKSTVEVLTRNLMCPAVVVKLPGQTHSLQDDIAAIIPVMKCIQPKGPYNLVGISWGGICAIELAKQLQAKGDKTQVFLLEGAPQTSQDIARLLGDDDQLQVNLLIRLLNLTSYTVYKDLLSLPDWSSRVHRALSELPHTSVLSKQYLSCAVEALYRRVESLIQYKPREELLSGQVVLIRPNTQPDDTCGLEMFFKKSLNVVLVDGDHKSLLERSEVANIISELSLVDLHWISQRV